MKGTPFKREQISRVVLGQSSTPPGKTKRSASAELIDEAGISGFNSSCGKTIRRAVICRQPLIALVAVACFARLTLAVLPTGLVSWRARGTPPITMSRRTLMERVME